jgi:hypothetical protein
MPVPVYGNVDGFPYDDYTIKGIQKAHAIQDALFNALGVTFKEHAQEIQGAGQVMHTHRI